MGCAARKGVRARPPLARARTRRRVTGLYSCGAVRSPVARRGGSSCWSRGVQAFWGASHASSRAAPPPSRGLRRGRRPSARLSRRGSRGRRGRSSAPPPRARAPSSPPAPHRRRPRAGWLSRLRWSTRRSASAPARPRRARRTRRASRRGASPASRPRRPRAAGSASWRPPAPSGSRA
eukprot:6034385-Prymnesium_polylepis.1